MTPPLVIVEQLAVLKSIATGVWALVWLAMAHLVVSVSKRL